MDKPPAPSRNIRSITDVLDDIVGDLERPTQENVLVLRKAWEKLVGSQIAKHSQPGFIKDNNLFVFVDHPGWMPELERMKRPLLIKLQASYRELRIRKLCFTLQNK